MKNITEYTRLTKLEIENDISLTEEAKNSLKTQLGITNGNSDFGNNISDLGKGSIDKVMQPSDGYNYIPKEYLHANDNHIETKNTFNMLNSFYLSCINPGDAGMFEYNSRKVSELILEFLTKKCPTQTALNSLNFTKIKLGSYEMPRPNIPSDSNVKESLEQMNYGFHIAFLYKIIDMFLFNGQFRSFLISIKDDFDNIMKNKESSFDVDTLSISNYFDLELDDLDNTTEKEYLKK